MAEKMTLLPCPFCGAPAAKNRNPGDRWVYYCPNGHTGYLRHKEWQARSHLAPPLQAVDVGLVERLRKRAAEERQIAENNARVAEMLAPELARFNVRDAHNIYATRMAIDHRDSAKRDAAFADDLEAAVVAITRAIGNTYDNE